jgi:hypothetical protein
MLAPREKPMDNHLSMLLQEIEEFGQGHDVQESQHARRLLNLEHVTAELIRMLLLCSQRKCVLDWNVKWLQRDLLGVNATRHSRLLFADND